MLQGSGTPIAESVPTKDALMYLRKYAGGPVYAPVTGFNSLYYGNTGIESAEDRVLSGTDDRLFVQRLTNLLTGRDTRGGNVLLTINKQAQAAAYDRAGRPQGCGGRAGPGDRRDPGRGQHARPIDPNALSSHSADGIQAAYKKYNADPNNPLLNRAFDVTYPPGSVFKLVVVGRRAEERPDADRPGSRR